MNNIEDDRDPLEKGPLPGDPHLDAAMWEKMRSTLAASGTIRSGTVSRRSEAEREELVRQQADLVRSELLSMRNQSRARPVRRVLPMGIAATLLVAFGAIFIINQMPQETLYRGELQVLPSVAATDPAASARSLVTALAGVGVTAQAYEMDGEWSVEAEIPAERLGAVRRVFAEAGIAEVAAGSVQVRFRVRLPDEAAGGR